MSADVLMTGEDRDLLPTDLIADTETSRQLIVQQMDTVVSIGEGEWPVNIFDGIDWIGYLTERRVNVLALTADVKREFESIPNVSITKIRGDQTGRVITVIVEGFLSQAPFQLTILSEQDNVDVVGDNSILVPIFLRWGYSSIS